MKRAVVVLLLMIANAVFGPGKVKTVEKEPAPVRLAQKSVLPREAPCSEEGFVAL